MARVERPLWGDEAKGKIKSTLTIFPRSGNLGCTDADPKEWYHVNFINYQKQKETDPREQWKEAFVAAVGVWRGMTEEEKAAFDSEALPLETGYNAYLRLTLKGEEEGEGMFTGPIWGGCLIGGETLTWDVTGALPDVYLIAVHLFDKWVHKSYEDVQINLSHTFNVV